MKNLIAILFLISTSLFSFAQNGSVGIGTSAPDPSALLELLSGNKGIMLPKINLNDNDLSDYSFMSAKPSTSLLVYNINKNTPGGEGLYYWDGTKWIFYLNSSNINLVLGITKYKAKTYNTGISTSVYNTESGSVNSFINGSALATPWIEIKDATPLTYTIERPNNSSVITFTGMLQVNNTSSSDANLNYGLGIFVDNKLIASKSAAITADNFCAFQEFTITGLANNLSVGTHTVTLAVMNRSSNTTASVNYGQKAADCNTISNDEAKISAIVLINQPLSYQ